MRGKKKAKNVKQKIGKEKARQREREEGELKYKYAANWVNSNTICALAYNMCYIMNENLNKSHMHTNEKAIQWKWK